MTASCDDEESSSTSRSPFFDVAALRHDEDDARRAFDLVADDDLVDGLHRAAFDDGDEKVAALHLVETELRRGRTRSRDQHTDERDESEAGNRSEHGVLPHPADNRLAKC